VAGLPPLVCVVEDDDSVREALSDLLKELGLQARAFPSADAFLAYDAVSEVKCLLLDVAMPGMSGPDLQLELNRRRLGIPIIFITGDHSVDLRERLLQNGAVACLFKPFGDGALIEAIEVALHAT
jgi:FixJ family two-component response regulator